MAKFFGNLHLVLVAGLVLSLALMFGLHGDGLTAQSVTRWLHTFFGIVWIGLLYYFNFVQIPTMPKIPAELKPAVSKHIAPSALFFFCWAAALTVLLGRLFSFHQQGGMSCFGRIFSGSIVIQPCISWFCH